jgi:hypothetical protein
MDEAPMSALPLNFHVLRSASKASAAELQIPRPNWTEHATTMVRGPTGSMHVDAGMIAWIIRA